MRKSLWIVLAAIIVTAVTAGFAVGNAGRENDKTFEYAVGLWGDLPYSAAQESTGLPNLLQDMNDANLAFTVHNGDLKQGSGSPCDNALYERARAWFNSLDRAAMFTPGDNDWTDCDRPANGGFSSRERLDRERQVFFGTTYSLGQHPIKQDVQMTPSCLGVAGSTACVENRRWTVKDVTYVTLNIPGSCNNRCDTAPDEAEYQARNLANIAWLQEAFAAATREQAAAVMIVAQANPGFDATDGTRAPLRNPSTLVETDAQPDGYHDFLVALRNQVTSFRKPVAYVHGDSHYFRIDKPLLDDQGRRLENFTRVETFGDNAPNGNNDVHWTKALVDPKSRDVFAFQPQIVAANRTAVPAP